MADGMDSVCECRSSVFVCLFLTVAYLDAAAVYDNGAVTESSLSSKKKLLSPPPADRLPGNAGDRDPNRGGPSSRRRGMSSPVLLGNSGTDQGQTRSRWKRMRNGRRKKGPAVSNLSSDDYPEFTSTSPIPPKFIVVVKLGVRVSRLNETSILALRDAFSTVLQVPFENTRIDKISFHGNAVEMFFIKDGKKMGQHFNITDLLSANLVLQTPDLLAKVKSQLNYLHIKSIGYMNIYEVELLEEPIWVQPFFPYVIATCAAVLIILLSLLIYCCCKQKAKKSSTEPAARIFCPTLKPNMKDAMMVQPESSPVYIMKHCGPPLAQTPVQLRSEGLLKRRGSSASLTLDLNPSPELSRWEGTPPKESSGLEFLMSAGNRLSRRDLRNAVKNTKALYEEFWEIPMNHPEKVHVAGSGMKNRYKTIIPNEHSRVGLPDSEWDPLSSYINANYIRGYEGEPHAYIATQGPMSHTIVDFWRLIWHEKAPIIVMITKLKEKSKAKCENYLPEKQGSFGDIEVTIEKVVEKCGYIVQHLILRRKTELHHVLQYWYTAWPDHKPPDSPKMLLDLVKEVELRRYDDGGITPKGPVTVHCSAGIGRTGCFVAISIGIRQLREEHSVDILGIVCSMRMDRGGMIQTHEQYEFIHQALCEYEKELGDPLHSGE